MKKLICTVLAICLSLALILPATAAGKVAISRAGLEFIAKFEGFSSKAYCYEGAWYIGYGMSCGKDEYPNGITKEQALDMMEARMPVYAQQLERFLNTHGATLNQAQTDAMLSMTYGTNGWLTTQYSLGRYVLGLQEYTDLDFVNSIGCWCHSAGGVMLEGLAKRHIAEAQLFLYGDYSGSNCPQYVFLHFDVNGGTQESDVHYYHQGGVYDFLPVPTRSGYGFIGWYLADGTRIMLGMTASKNQKVTARWGTPAQGQAYLAELEAAQKKLSPTQEEPHKPNPIQDGYPDVRESDWFYSYVMDLTRDGVIDGYPDGTYKPENEAACGEVLKLIACNSGYGKQEPANGHWAGGYLELALQEGWVEPGEITDLDAPVTRLLVAQMVAKALDLPKVYTASPYEDCKDAYVLSLYRYGLMIGETLSNGETWFHPQDGIRRSEICTVIWRMNRVDLHQGQIKANGDWIDIDQTLAVNSYDPDAFTFDENGFVSYTGDDAEVVQGIDVSSWQDEVNWQKVADSGVKFVFLRVGYRGYTEGKIYVDERFQENLQGAKAAGLDVGVYFYSQAISVQEAQEEADFVLQQLGGESLTYPVAFDWEYAEADNARTNSMTKETLTACAIAFCQRIQQAGYEAMIYSGQSVIYPLYDMAQLQQYPLWLALYSERPYYYYDFQIWQYGCGKVPGIYGETDMDVLMIKK